MSGTQIGPDGRPPIVLTRQPFDAEERAGVRNARRGLMILAAYRELVGSDEESDAADLVADILHAVAARLVDDVDGHTPDEVLGKARDYFDSEHFPLVRYVATISVPGYMPMDDDPPVLETTQAAWQYLRDERERGLDQAEDWDEDDQTLAVLDSLAKGHSKDGESPGSVVGPTPGYEGDHDLGLIYAVRIYEED